MVLINLLLQNNAQELLSPVLQLHQRDSLHQHHERRRSRHMNLASNQPSVHRLLLYYVLHDRVRDTIHKPHIVRSVQLLRLQVTRFLLPYWRIHSDMLRFGLRRRQTLPQRLHRHFLGYWNVHRALFIETQSQTVRCRVRILENRRFLHTTHAEERSVPASERGRRLEATCKILENFLGVVGTGLVEGLDCADRSIDPDHTTRGFAAAGNAIHLVAVAFDKIHCIQNNVIVTS